MAHFAKLDENNNVIEVVVIHNNECLDGDGNESEEVGIAFCRSLFGSETNWVQTSYNGNMRKNFAGIGGTYDPDQDCFIPAKQYDSWVLNQTSFQWEPPVEFPDDGGRYEWNETTRSWDSV